MFVKRDLRKIDELIYDPVAVKELSLSRRPAEFSASLKPLINNTNLPLLTPLLTLSVYDCEISDVSALSKLGNTAIREINIGRNPVKSLPTGLACLETLKLFWAEDVQLEGEFPECLYSMSNLENVRLSGNMIDTLSGPKLKNMSSLKSLNLDNNEIVEIPVEMGSLVNMESLSLRSNKIEYLPESVIGGMKNLTMLHVSSNKLAR